MIIFLYGADTFRSRRWLQELKTKFRHDVDPGDNSLNLIDGSTTTLVEISEKINTGSLFVKKRLVVIENIFRNKREKIFTDLTNYLKKFTGGEDNIIIFRDEELNSKEQPLKTEAKKLFTFLNQQPYSQEFKILTDSQLMSFIKNEAANYEKKISAPAASLLINLTGNDLWSIASDLKKLSFYAAGDTITPEEVKTMVTGLYDENIFGLTDALSAKNKKLAATLLAEQYAAGSSDEYLIAMLIRQFKILLQIRVALDNRINPADLATQLKLHPYVAKKGILQTKNFTSLSLKDYLNRLIQLDFANKTGRGDVKTELTLLISGL